MEGEATITDRSVIIMGNVGKLMYRTFIVIALYNIDTHLMGETTPMAIMTFLIMFPILWMTMKELMQDLHEFDNRKTISTKDKKSNIG